MTPRRSNGEGSIYRTRDGSGWVAALELPLGADGKRVRRRRRASTKAGARELLRQMQEEVVTRGSVSDPHRLVSSSIETYMAVRAAEGLSVKTIETDQWRANIINRGLGRRRVANLTVADCDLFLRSAGEGAYSSTDGGEKGSIGTPQLRRLRGFLIRALRNDIRLGLLGRNVAELSVLPAAGVPSRPRRALSVDQLTYLEDLATGVMAILIDLSGRYALRPGEARAVLWSDYDQTTSNLRVGHRLDRRNNRVGPKTKAAARTLQLDAKSGKLLASWRHQQAQHRKAAGPAWTETGLIATSAAGTALHYGNVQRALNALSHRIELDPPVSHYELRHTAITHQAAAGHSAWQIADWAGTSERMITDVYRHKLTDTSPLGPPI